MVSNILSIQPNNGVSMFWQQFTNLICFKSVLTKTSLPLYLVSTSPVLTEGGRDEAHVEQREISRILQMLSWKWSGCGLFWDCADTPGKRGEGNRELGDVWVPGTLHATQSTTVQTIYKAWDPAPSWHPGFPPLDPQAQRDGQPGPGGHAMSESSLGSADRSLLTLSPPSPPPSPQRPDRSRSGVVGTEGTHRLRATAVAAAVAGAELVAGSRGAPWQGAHGRVCPWDVLCASTLRSPHSWHQSSGSWGPLPGASQHCLPPLLAQKAPILPSGSWAPPSNSEVDKCPASSAVRRKPRHWGGKGQVP